jgi:hypothetical protein
LFLFHYSVQVQVLECCHLQCDVAEQDARQGGSSATPPSQTPGTRGTEGTAKKMLSYHFERFVGNTYIDWKDKSNLS